MGDFWHAFEVVRTAHRNQRYPDGSAYWYHLLRVGMHVRSLTDDEAMISAALGHDLLEDTDIGESEIRESLGDEATDIIVELTNTMGDDDVLPYVHRMQAASEKARIIKLADLIDNYTSLVFRYPESKAGYFRTVVIPIMEPMAKAMLNTRLEKWGSVGERLKSELQFQRRRAKEFLERIES